MLAILHKTAPLIAMSAAGIFFMTGLLSGIWKYACMRASENGEAPYYVNIAHRAALMYAFAAVLIAHFAYYSVWPDRVNIAATIAPLVFFAIAILNYIKLGMENQTDNHLRDSANPALDRVLILTLIVAETGGFGILLAGFFVGLFR